ncbi:hypothetical protein DFQ27_006055 [Actinomortierella ambigua]|uniref:Uncharacterized protein n=1 Tax=Actinomortierella ambigua TaxID=1343610 RepID=A0A9P6PYV7_9FUNG|nr:hypothetical protein DFQ27_006055 [Actinomortierella ambigua]
MRGYPDSQGMSGTSFYDGGPGANPVRASSQNAHRQPYQPSHQYYYTPPEYDHFTPDGASPSQPAQPLDDGSVSSGSRRPYTPVTEQSTYEHYYNAAGVATAAAANPRNDLEAANLMHVYEPPDNAPSTVASPLANLNTASTRSVGTGKASYSSPSPSSTHATSRSAQPLIDPTNPRINRATRPGASSTQTSPDRYAPTPCAPIEGSDPKYFQAGIGSYGPGAHGAVDDRRRPQSLLSDSSAGSSRASTSPQYIPPGPGRNSQWFGSPQDYGGGKAPIIHSTKGSRWSESAMTESEMSGNAGWQQQHQQQQQPMVWGNQNYSQGGNQYSTNDNITNYNNNNYYNNSNNSYQAEGSRRANSGSTGQRGGAVASRSARYKDPREAIRV